jgi:hypothetical protein
VASGAGDQNQQERLGHYLVDSLQFPDNMSGFIVWLIQSCWIEGCITQAASRRHSPRRCCHQRWAGARNQTEGQVRPD